MVLRCVLLLLPLLGVAASAQDAADPVAYRLTVGDVLPALEQALEGQLVRTLVDDVLGRDLGPLTPDLDELARGLREAASNIPERIEVELHASALRALDGLVRGAIHGTAALAEASQEGAAAEARLAREEDAVVAALGAVSMPRLALRVRFRDPAMARQAFLVGAMGLGSGSGKLGLETTYGNGSVRIEAAMTNVLERDELEEAVGDLGWVRFPSPASEQAAAILAGWQMRLDIVSAGPEISLVVGPATDEAPGPPAIERVGLDGDLLAVHWDHGVLGDSVAAWLADVEGYAGTATGDLLAEWDTEEMISTLRVLGRTLARSPTRGRARGRLLDDGLELLVEESGVEGVPSLHETGVASWIPPGSASFGMDATASLADLLADMVMQLEDRLAAISLRAELGDRPEQADRFERITEGWYGAFDDFRAQIVEAAPGVFEPGHGWVLREQGRVWVHVTSDGQARPIAPDGLPWVQVALVGRVRDGRAAAAWVDDCLSALVRGLAATLGESAPDDGTYLEQVDLRLDTPTYRLSWDGIRRLAGADPGDGVHFEGDLQPHWFFHEGWVVVSLSPDLSRELLTGFGQDDPAASPGELTRGRFRLSSIGALGKGIFHLLDQDGMPTADLEGFDEVVGRVIEYCESSPMEFVWGGSQSQDRRESSYRLTTR